MQKIVDGTPNELPEGFAELTAELGRVLNGRDRELVCDVLLNALAQGMAPTHTPDEAGEHLAVLVEAVQQDTAFANLTPLGHA